jgi:hypothetical protein
MLEVVSRRAGGAAGAALALAGALACAHAPAGAPSAGPADAAAPASVRVEYRPPRNPDHQALADSLRQRRALEPFAEVLGTLRLPRTLTLALRGCDGTSNAWYEPADATVTFCYEYVAEIARNAPKAAEQGISADDARDGPIAFVLLHETSHALFDLLAAPVLGHEEDAADQVAGFVLLGTGRDTARRLLTGAAWMYLRDARTHRADESDFADVHALDAQRYYNVLCLAYGSDPEFFGGIVRRGYLPAERAETCEEEWRQVEYAVKTLIQGKVDTEAMARVRARYQKRWGAPVKGAR